jgi:ATP phosphoribosyltransferase
VDVADVLRVAVPAGGEFRDAAASLLTDAGYDERADGSTRIYRLPERDIPVYVADGSVDLGLCGLLMIHERSTRVQVLVDLGLGSPELAIFTPPGPATALQDLAGCRIATAFPQVVRRFLALHGVVVESVVHLDPASNAIELGIADAVAETDHGVASCRVPLARVAKVESSQAVIVEERPRFDGADEPSAKAAEKAAFVESVRAARFARSVRLVECECPTAVVENVLSAVPAQRVSVAATEQDRGWSSVRMLVGRSEVAAAVDQLLGCRCREITISEAIGYHPGRRPADVDGASRPSVRRGAPLVP